MKTRRVGVARAQPLMREKDEAIAARLRVLDALDAVVEPELALAPKRLVRPELAERDERVARHDCEGRLEVLDPAPRRADLLPHDADPVLVDLAFLGLELLFGLDLAAPRDRAADDQPGADEARQHDAEDHGPALKPPQTLPRLVRAAAGRDAAVLLAAGRRVLAGPARVAERRVARAVVGRVRHVEAAEVAVVVRVRFEAEHERTVLAGRARRRELGHERLALGERLADRGRVQVRDDADGSRRLGKGPTAEAGEPFDEDGRTAAKHFRP
mmetsp:Transcript_9647/g.30044  ORF Transcript_9647/g.30044 Transcript_9647/m.30044 type:complete len:271 (+) Transcript_9647:1160-1972(+)